MAVASSLSSVASSSSPPTHGESPTTSLAGSSRSTHPGPSEMTTPPPSPLCSPATPLRSPTPKFGLAAKKEKAPLPSSKPAKSGGGKQKKKGKQKEKVNNMVLFDQATYDKLLSEDPKFKLVTPSILSDRLRINGSLVRRAIKDLMATGSIRMITAHASQQIYTRATNT